MRQYTDKIFIQESTLALLRPRLLPSPFVFIQKSRIKTDPAPQHQYITGIKSTLCCSMYRMAAAKLFAPGPPLPNGASRCL